MPLINESAEWKKLEQHAVSVKQQHLKTLLQDAGRCSALTAEFDGIMMDFSRENVVPATMDMLFDLAGAAGLEQKRAAMAAGVHINTTEDRAVMHVALRAPKTKQLIVDGEDVVPAVHAVLAKIGDFADRVRNGSWTINRARADIGEPPNDGGDDPLLVDRQNMVLWSDLSDLSGRCFPCFVGFDC